MTQSTNSRVPPAETAPDRSAWRAALREFVFGFLPWIVLVLVARTFIVEPFNIPSGSMIPTLQVGDYVAVTKYSYGYSHFSLPFSPDLFDGRVFGAMPHRGDVAVFRFTKDTSIDYIKRIVGLPGDHIQVRGGALYVNGARVQRESLGPYSVRDERSVLSGIRYRETLPGSAGHAPVVHEILKLTDDGMQNDTPDYVVPEGYFFAMGDDRDDSEDSRFQDDGPDALGFVPMVNLVGKAQFVFFSAAPGHPWWQVWYWPIDIRWSRLLHGVR